MLSKIRNFKDYTECNCIVAQLSMNMKRISFALSLILVSITLGSPFSASSQVLINEFSCSNINGPVDAFGDREDWIELYNTSATPFDLTGYYLSDKSGNLLKWQIPSGTVPANGYLMVQCSRRNTVQGGELHPNFNLKQTQNEWIILTNPGGVVMDSLRIVNMTQMDHSVGRSTDGAPDWKLFTTPTPGASNTGAVEFYEPKPVMSLAPGFYSGAQTVTITCPNPNATIHYTTDGTDPNASSPVYTGPITINQTSVVRAIAYDVNPPSFIETNTYFIDENHGVPVVSVCSADLYDLVANGNQGPDDVGAFELFEQDGSFIDEGQGHFNKHGNDSWAYPQRGFDFIMRDQFGYNDDIDHLIFPNDTDRSDFQRLILKPGASDNYPFETGGAHIRDAFIHTLSIRADMLLDERTWRPCVVYLNGEYWGVYEIREKADDHDYTDYYYDQDKFDLQYLKTWGATWQEYGAPNAQQDWDDIVNYIMTNNMAPGPAFDYAKSQLKWASLCDYFMFNSYVVNQDWLNWNTAWWRGLNPLGSKKKWRYVLWDMDASFGHYINFTGIPDPTANADPCNVENLPNPGGQGHTDILEKLINENPDVEQYYVTRYIDLINTHFSCNYMNQLLDSMLNEIAPEMVAHTARWGGSVAGWQANVQQLRDFINARCAAMEQGLIDCYSLTGPYDVTFDVDPPNSGKIQVNSINPPSYPWTTQYFGAINTITIANPEPGFMFDHWEYQVGPMNNAITVDTNGVMLSANDSIIAVFVPTVDDDDGDGVPNDQEVIDGTDPNDPCDYLVGSVSISVTSGSDCDGDGFSDADEILNGSNPFDPCDPDDSDPQCQIDTDGDGVTDLAENAGGTDPNDPCDYSVVAVTLPIVSGSDCDGDGIDDATEIANNTNPFDPCDPNATGVECATGIHVPSAFSPNGDGTNDALGIIVGTDVVTYTIRIYDRWGNLIVMSSEEGFEWDGTHNGTLCNSGVYAYMLEVVFDDGSAELREGNITLLR
jgi:gliding motility-associated-like protein